MICCKDFDPMSSFEKRRKKQAKNKVEEKAEKAKTLLAKAKKGKSAARKGSKDDILNMGGGDSDPEVGISSKQGDKAK